MRRYVRAHLKPQQIEIERHNEWILGQQQLVVARALPDFERLPKLNRALVHDLATGRYLTERAPVLLFGPCGTGKSPLAQALGHCAIR